MFGERTSEGDVMAAVSEASRRRAHGQPWAWLGSSWFGQAYLDTMANWRFLWSFGSAKPCEARRFRGSDHEAVLHDMEIVFRDFSVACHQVLEREGITLSQGKRGGQTRATPPHGGGEPKD